MSKLMISLVVFALVGVTYLSIPDVASTDDRPCNECLAGYPVNHYICLYMGDPGGDWNCVEFINGTTACCAPPSIWGAPPCDDLTYHPDVPAQLVQPANGWCDPIPFCPSCSPVNFQHKASGSHPQCQPTGDPVQRNGLHNCTP